ncbi:flagellar basal body P-ring formation chaperone FlgA [Thauera sp.]|uniref:flagellar basal body P-ring formation chaperone FlgA n=1 Tax=Thauera sp. TaxID=1905334 RepID=UPI0039E54150
MDHQFRSPTAPRFAKLCRAGLLSLVLFAALSPSPSAAQQPSEPVEAAVRSLLERETLGQPGEVRINVRTFDPANQLPPCTALDAFLQPGTRAWGQLTVGIRCDAPTAWTAWAQATVQVFGPYLVTTRAMRSAEVIGEADIEVREGELSALPDNILSAPKQAIGHVTRFAQAAGAPLRAGSLRQADAVRRGQTVPVTTRGPGFTVSGEGQALNGAAAGERVRLRLGNGQIVQGTVRPDGTVDVEF